MLSHRRQFMAISHALLNWFGEHHPDAYTKLPRATQYALNLNFKDRTVTIEAGNTVTHTVTKVRTHARDAQFVAIPRTVTAVSDAFPVLGTATQHPLHEVLDTLLRRVLSDQSSLRVEVISRGVACAIGLQLISPHTGRVFYNRAFIFADDTAVQLDLSHRGRLFDRFHAETGGEEHLLSVRDDGSYEALVCHNEHLVYAEGRWPMMGFTVLSSNLTYDRRGIALKTGKGWIVITETLDGDTLYPYRCLTIPDPYREQLTLPSDCRIGEETFGLLLNIGMLRRAVSFTAE